MIEKRVDGVETDLRIMRTELQSEIRDTLAAFREAEAERKTAFSDLSQQIKGLSIEVSGAQSSLPTKDTVRNWVLAGVALMVALVALVWQVFGIGGDVAGNFADRVLESERKQQQIIEMLEEQGDDKAT